MGGLLALKAAERVAISGLVLIGSELPRDLQVPARSFELRERKDEREDAAGSEDAGGSRGVVGNGAAHLDARGNRLRVSRLRGRTLRKVRR